MKQDWIIPILMSTKQFKYLGFILSERNKIKKEIEARIQPGNKRF